MLFESLVIRDLRVYADAARGPVDQYRDNTGLEVDAIVTRSDGRWGAFEIKLGTFAIDDAVKTLRRFTAKVDTRVLGAPSVLGVIVGTGGARTPDGFGRVIALGAMPFEGSAIERSSNAELVHGARQPQSSLPPRTLLDACEYIN